MTEEERMRRSKENKLKMINMHKKYQKEKAKAESTIWGFFILFIAVIVMMAM